jgi:hypothetical protein
MKLTYKQKRDIASKIPGEYDYMDHLPMNGWAWEFVRRNGQYIEAFIELEKLTKSGVWNDVCDKMLSKMSAVASPGGLIIMGRTRSVSQFDEKKFLKYKLPPYKEGDNVRLNKYLGNIHHEGAVPRPGKRYIDISGLLFFPRKKDYKIYGSFNDLLNREKIITIDFESNTKTEKPKLNRSDEDVFYISVYKKSNIADLKEYLLADIAKILEKNKPRIRQRKWKYYLIVYDLKKKFSDKISYDEIADILIEAYPDKAEAKSFDDERNIISWYTSAKSLINGGYKKYLRQTTPPAKSH